MHRQHLELLACPGCRDSLTLEASAAEAVDGHVLEGEIACSGCTLQFPIRRGVPRLLPDRAARSPDREETAHRFGYQWNRFSKFDRDEERASMATWLRPHRLEDLEGLTVLDAGCGMGRHATLAIESGASCVVGIDLGSAVDAAFANTRHLERVCIVQGDVYRPPLRPAIFDAAYSLGVLHHTPDPAGAFRALAPAVRSGGWFQLWLYGREGNGWIVHIVNPIRRLTSKMPLDLLRLLSAVLTPPVVLAARLARVPGFGRAVPYREYLAWLGAFGFRKIHAIVFDHAVAPTAFYLKRSEVEAMVHEAGWHLARIEHSRGMSWGVDARPTAGDENTV